MLSARFVAPGVLLLLSGGSCWAKDKDAREEPSRATIVTISEREIENVEIREETFAKVRYKPKGARMEEIAGKDILEIHYLDPPGAYATGKSQLRAGLYRKAQVSFASVKNASPEDHWAWAYASRWLGESLLLAGKGEEAAKEFERFLQAQGGHFLEPAVLEGLGRSLIAQGAYKKARDTFSKLDEGYSKYWSAKGQLGIGDAALAQGDPRGARKGYKFAADRVQGTRYRDMARAAKVGVGRSYVADKRWKEAIKEFDEISREAGASPEVAGGAWIGKGDCLRAQAKENNDDANLLKKALIAYQTCVVRYALTPEAYPKALYQSALLYDTLKLPVLAQRMREELKSRCPNSPWSKKLKE